MKIIKFEHSGFYLEKEGRGLLFDPVEFEEKLPEFNNLDAIVITHKHGDHFQPEVLARVREKNPDAQVFTPADNVEAIPGAEVDKNGEKVQAGVFELEFYGENHAEIVPGEVPCMNVCAVVDGVFANSGDSFDKPPVQPEILLAPLSAPWMKMSETMDFVRSVGPKVVVPTHDGLSSALGKEVCDNWVKKACEEIGAEYRAIHRGEIS